MSSLLAVEKVLSVHHWNDKLFSFKTTRAQDFRFKNGYYTMIGLEVNGKPLLRAYSIASANHEPELEFFSIKVPNGPLTSRLQHMKVGDEIYVGTKPTGTLIDDQLLPGKNLYMISTGTGLAPFMSMIKDPEIYDAYDKVILTHGVRYTSELAYADYIQNELPNDEYLGDVIKEKLVYYPTVTREPFKTTGRLTDLIKSGQLSRDLGLSDISPENDRFMICGSFPMIEDTCALLESMGFEAGKRGYMGHYVTEKAFVER